MDKNLHQNAKAPMIALILFNLFAFSMIAKSQTALCAPKDERPASSTYSLTVNDGTDYNSSVPISGDWVANASYSQFIIPAGDLAVMKWGTISKMTFYPHQEFSNLDWGNAEFEVYMTETGQTTLSSLIDWSDMNMVRNSARLQIINGQMIVMLDSPYHYLGGNLLIGFKQTVPGTTNNCFWYGVEVLGASLGNNGPKIQQWNFLPKTTFDYDFVQMPECLPVTGLTSSDIDLYSANLSWTAGESGETAWKLQYQAHGATEWTTIDVHSTDLVGGAYPLTSLNSGTIYHWQVAAWCDTANEEAISPYAYGPDFITLCQAFTTLDENFDSYAPSLSNTDNSLPPCWNYINTSNDIYTPFISGYPSITNGQYHSASNKLEFRFFGYEGDASGEEIAILPLMESLDGMRIRFYARCSRKSDLIVGTMTDPTDASTFVALEDGMITDLPPSYGQYVLNLNSDNGNYIAFKMNAPEGTFSFNQIFVDDVVVEVIPPCGDAPTLNTATSDGAHGFEATFSPISTEQGEWIYAVTTTDDLPSTNIALQGNTTAPEGFGVQTGLESDTDYWLWVGYACDIDGKTYWSNSLPFHTEISCPPIVVDTPVPIPHGAILTWEGNSDYYDVYYREPEYINMSVGLFQGFENGLQGWTLRDCASETGIVSSANVHGGKYIFMFNWLSGDPQNLISPLLNEGTNGWFTFYYRQYSGGQATQTFRVGYSSTTNETDAFTFGDEITSSNEVEWLLFSEEMPAGTKYVCIQYTSNNYWFYIDDILVGAPTVPASAWQLAGGNITANTYTINQPAITLETSYEAKVVGYCIVDNKTIESDVVGFTTDACSAPIAQVSNIHYYGADVEWNSYSDSYTVQYRETTFLFEEDFESEESFANWTFISENPENEGYAGRHVDAAYNRSYGFTFSSLASASNSKYDQYLISPELAVTGYLKFYFRKPYGANESLYVGVSTTTSDLNAFTWSGDLVPTQSWQQYVQELPADVKYIAFHYYGNNKFYVYIDGITITSEAATGDWMVINDAVSPYTLSDLIPGTGYEVKVHGICDGTNSDWSETLTFTTEVYTFSGSGTETAPYLIATTDDMDALAYMVNKGNNCSGLYFRMEADLVYSGKTYTPVGTSANRFQGHFDGDGHSISNVVINQPGQSYQGLFGTIGDNGTVKNLVLGAGSSITAKHYVGGITGWCFGTVTGCTVSEGVNITGDFYVGGIAGNSSYNPVTDNLNLGVVSGNDFTGGIVGSKPNNITSLSNNYYAGNCTVGGINGSDWSGEAMRGWVVSAADGIFVQQMPDEDNNFTGITYDGIIYLGAGQTGYLIVGRMDSSAGNFTASAGTLTAVSSEVFTENYYSLAMPTEGQDVVISSADIALTVPGYDTSENGGWRFIASPVEGSIEAASVGNIFLWNYDLYRFNQSAMKEWENYKQEGEHYHFALENGRGYLYATKTDITLLFGGTYNDAETHNVPLDYDANADFSGWNLVGNPFPVEAYANRSYYTMNADGTAIEPNAVSSATAIPACTGVMVKAEDENQSVTFSRTAPEAGASQGSIQIAVAQANTRGNAVEDKAILSFNEGDQLGKFVFNEDNAKLYIPQGGKDYAIAVLGRDAMHCVSTETLVHFKAAKNGTYTLTVNVENMDLDYLHLIDNLTGADVDLLGDARQGDARQGDARHCASTYTFAAKTTDYASRFRLIFNAEDASAGSASDAPFAYINNGNIIITADADGATLQIVDVMGRVVLCRDAMPCVSTNGMAPGMYVLRLIDGDSVRTQKIVVD